MKKALFSLGRTVATPGALSALEDNEAFNLMARHQTGDWGKCSDPEVNDEALKIGARILSVYDTNNGTEVWVLTEADRSATTVLLPSDY